MKQYIKKHKITIFLILFVLIGGGYYWYAKTQKTAAIVQYKTAQAEKGNLVVSISGSGNVIVDQLATVDPTITGTVSDLAVNVGDNVKKGEILFQIINNDLSVSNDKASASLQQAKNSIDSAEIQVKQAKADYDAAKKNDASTSDQKKILKDKINLAEQAVTAAEKNYKASLADYNNQLADGSKRTVKAPIDGTVSAINIKNGDDLSRLSASSTANDAPIIIGDLKTLKAQIQVNEVDIPNVSIGQEVVMNFSAIDGLNITGKVEKIDALGTLNQGVVTYNVTIGFDSLDSRIRPQMSVSAKIITDVKKNVIIVPNGALKTQGNKTYVEVLNVGAKTPERRIIEPGVSNNTETEIVNGINAGDKVVTQTIDPNTKTTQTTTTGGGRGGLGGIMR